MGSCYSFCGPGCGSGLNKRKRRYSMVYPTGKSSLAVLLITFLFFTRILAVLAQETKTRKNIINSLETIIESGRPLVIHVFVALCDNEHQGIIPVAPKLGNGEDCENNLYWGASYGVKTYFEQSEDWELIAVIEEPRDIILERVVFYKELSGGDIFLVADAYKGVEMMSAIEEFLDSTAGNKVQKIRIVREGKSIEIKAGGASQLVAYVGHNGLMDENLTETPAERRNSISRDVIILACISQLYFDIPLREVEAYPLLWTTGLIAPEAYTLEAAVDGWVRMETAKQIRDRACKAYSKYQRCGLNAARSLFVTGWQGE